MKIRLASPITRDSIVDGPGLRAVIWAQGCFHHCPGCHNPCTHNPFGGFEMDTADVIEQIRSLRLQQGITLSGGEPFLHFFFIYLIFIQFSIIFSNGIPFITSFCTKI